MSYLLSPTTWKFVNEFVSLRRWEFRLTNRHSLHVRKGFIYYAGRTFPPQYVIGGTIFMLICGIDIFASLGTELVGDNNQPNKSEEFQRLLQEKKARQKDKREQFDVIRSTTEASRAGQFAATEGQ